MTPFDRPGIRRVAGPGRFLENDMRDSNAAGVVAAIVAKRKLEGMSERELARRVGKNRGTVHKYLNGKLRPNAVTLERMLRVVGLEVEGYSS